MNIRGLPVLILCVGLAGGCRPASRAPAGSVRVYVAVSSQSETCTVDGQPAALNNEDALALVLSGRLSAGGLTYQPYQGQPANAVTVISADKGATWGAVRHAVGASGRAFIRDVEFQLTDGPLEYRLPDLSRNFGLPDPIFIQMYPSAPAIGATVVEVGDGKIMPGELSERLKKLIATYGNDRMVIINANGSLPFADVAGVMREATAAGLKEVRLGAGDVNVIRAGLGPLGWYSAQPVSNFPPKARFFGMGGSARNVVYCVQADESLKDDFEEIRRELLKSVSRLSSEQSFHVVMYSRAGVAENPPRKLTMATADGKKECSDFIKAVQPAGAGPSDPKEALNRAFEVLKGSTTRPNVIYLLTTGDLADRDGVTKLLTVLNKDKIAQLMVLLYNCPNKDTEEFLQTLANQNAGKFKKVEKMPGQ